MIRRLDVLGIVGGVMLIAAGPVLGQTEAPPDMEAFMEAMMGAMGKAAGQGEGEDAKPYTPIDHKKLKEALPAELPGMTRASASSERNAAMGINVASAEAAYKNEEGARITIKISDMGSMGGFMAMAQFGWAMSDYERETETGFERTTNWKGHKAMEEFDSANRSGSFTAMLEKIILEVSGYQVDFNQIEAARDAVSIDDLLALRAQPAEEETAPAPVEEETAPPAAEE